LFGYLIAVNVRVARKVIWTVAFGFVIGHRTQSVRSARVGHHARADTLPVTASLCQWTVVIFGASGFFDGYTSALDIRISKESG